MWDSFQQWMNEPFFRTDSIVIDPWKVIGYAGALLFALRWVVQAAHRRRTGSNVMPTVFWVISLAGAGMTTLYFIFGKNDSVGILQNALPASVAFYNLVLDLRMKRTRALDAGDF